MSVDISIIVPVYNTEKYLERCVDSILVALGKKHGEILLIDNNSTDDSGKIVERYAKKYPSIIRSLKCKTQGLSAVRNYGAKMAKGEYIWFVDSDDTISKDSIKKLFDVANKTQSDLVMMGMERIYPDGTTDYLSAVRPDEKNYKSRFVRYGLGGVQVLIRRKWWLENNFQFKEGIIHEDMEMMSSLILYTDKFACVDEPLYFYYQNNDSILHKSTYNPNIYDIFSALEGLYQRFVDKDAAKKYHDELEWFFIWNLLIDSAKDFGQFPEGKSGLARSRKMLKQYFPGWRHNKFLKQKPLKLRARVRINYYK